MLNDQPNDVMIMIRPGKRPMSSMCPTILTDSMGVVKLVIGTPGIVFFYHFRFWRQWSQRRWWQALKAQIIGMAMMTNWKGASGGTKITTAVALVTLLHLERAKGFFVVWIFPYMLMYIWPIVMVQICSSFYFLELKFSQNADVWLRFCSWCVVENLKMKFD